MPMTCDLCGKLFFLAYGWSFDVVSSKLACSTCVPVVRKQIATIESTGQEVWSWVPIKGEV